MKPPKPHPQTSRAIIAGMTRNPMKNLVHPVILVIIVVFSACVDYPIYDRDSITFTATHDCEIWLFNSDTVQIARDYYEVGKAPFIVYIKESGEYLLFAERLPDRKIVKDRITFQSGNLEYYIEFD